MANIAKHEYICLHSDVVRWKANPLQLWNFRPYGPSTMPDILSIVMYGSLTWKFPRILSNRNDWSFVKTFPAQGGKHFRPWADCVDLSLCKCKFSLFGRGRVRPPVQKNLNCLWIVAFTFHRYIYILYVMKNNPLARMKGKRVAHL